MPEISGFGGGMTLPTGLIMTVMEWNAALDIDIAEVPAGFGENFHGAALGAGRFSGSLRAKGATGSTAPFVIPTAGAGWDSYKGTATLTAEAGCTYSATFAFHNINLRRMHGGYFEIGANFRNTGSDLAATWA